MVTDGDEQHPGITIRPASPADAASIATVHVASWRESYAGMLPEAMLLALSIAERTERWKGILGEASSMEGTAVFVAECEGQTVGFASGGARRDCGLHAQGLTGEISALYVLQRAQREGVGRRLMKAVAHASQMSSLGSEGTNRFRAPPVRYFGRASIDPPCTLEPTNPSRALFGVPSVAELLALRFDRRFV